jgi:hypothetical protein
VRLLWLDPRGSLMLGVRVLVCQGRLRIDPVAPVEN